MQGNLSFANKLAYSILFFTITCLFLPVHSNAFLINKEPYIIKEEKRYKEALRIKILPFKGEVDKERNYLYDLIKTFIKDKILSYKRIMIRDVILEYKRYPFDPFGIDKDSSKPDDTSKPESETTGKAPGFLTPVFVDETGQLSKFDIVIKGQVLQRANKIDVKLNVYNNLYGKKYTIQKGASIRKVDSLKEGLGNEILKAIIVDFAYLDIDSTPGKALIYIDGRYFGRTNKKKILIEAGRHNINIIKDNYISKSELITLQSNETKSIAPSLERKQPLINSIVNVVTTPTGARVYMDSCLVGHSPCKIKDFNRGIYRLRIEKDGFITKYATIEISTNKEEKIAFNLEKGNDYDHYFERTSVYDALFKYTLIGSAIGTFSYILIGLKIEDEKSDDRIDELRVYRNIALYTTITAFISAWVFYYLDVSEYDIEIALNYPRVYPSNPYPSWNGNYSFKGEALQGMGIRFRMRF